MVKQNPTFLLKGIDPKSILLKYRSGKFSTDESAKGSIHGMKSIQVMAPTYGKDFNSGIFSINGCNNSSIIYATTGHKDLEAYYNDEQDKEENHVCENCLRTFTSRPVGRPIKYLEKSILVDKVYKNLYIFWTEGVACGFRCRLSLLENANPDAMEFKNSPVSESIRLLKIWFYLTHPGQTLIRANHPHLLKSNGGSLPDEDWDNNDYIYVKSDRIITVPVKSQYIKKTLDIKTSINDINSNPYSDMIIQ